MEEKKSNKVYIAAISTIIAAIIGGIFTLVDTYLSENDIIVNDNQVTEGIDSLSRYNPLDFNTHPSFRSRYIEDDSLYMDFEEFEDKLVSVGISDTVGNLSSKITEADINAHNLLSVHHESLVESGSLLEEENTKESFSTETLVTSRVVNPKSAYLTRRISFEGAIFTVLTKPFNISDVSEELEDKAFNNADSYEKNRLRLDSTSGVEYVSYKNTAHEEGSKLASVLTVKRGEEARKYSLNMTDTKNLSDRFISYYEESYIPDRENNSIDMSGAQNSYTYYLSNLKMIVEIMGTISKNRLTNVSDEGLREKALSSRCVIKNLFLESIIFKNKTVYAKYKYNLEDISISGPR